MHLQREKEKKVQGRGITVSDLTEELFIDHSLCAKQVSEARYTMVN